MANKKKRKRHRQPVAPPVHSAPVSSHGPIPVAPTVQGPASSGGIDVPEAAPAQAPKPRRQTPGQLRNARKRQERRRNAVLLGVIGLLIVAGIVFAKVNGGKKSDEFKSITAAAGCGAVKDTSDSGAGEHLQPGEKTTYDTSPPSHGKHAVVPLPADIYEKGLSRDPTQDINIYRAVHSLEHGAVIIWYHNATKDQLNSLESKYRDAPKVLVVSYPQLKGKTHMALTAWGKLMDCNTASTKAADEFITRYREARSAPEPKNPI